MAIRAAIRRKGKDESCTFYVWFRHPVLGRPVERSLKTADEKHARTLAECLDLILADPAWHLRVRPGTPVEIVDVFYEPIKSQLRGVRFFEDPPKVIKNNPDGSIEGWYVSPTKHAAAERKIIEESFDALRWRQRFERLKKLLLKKERTLVMLSRKVGDLERRLSGKGTPPIGEAFKLYDAVVKTRVSRCTYLSHRPRVKKFVEAIGEDRPVGSVKPTEIDEYVLSVHTKDGKPVKALTRKNTRVDIGTFLNWCAKKWGYTSPMAHTEQIRAYSQQEIVYLTQEEVDVLLTECRGLYWRTFFAVFVYSGIRAAELRWLQVEDVDIEGRVIQVRTVTTPDETKVPKTGPRAVHYHQNLQPYLEAYIAAGLRGKRFFFPKQGEDRLRYKHGGEPDVWRASSLAHALSNILKPISKKIGKPINALILRHTFGSLLIRAGFNYVEVSTIMGNSPEICRRHYARLSPDEVRAAWPVNSSHIEEPTRAILLPASGALPMDSTPPGNAAAPASTCPPVSDPSSAPAAAMPSAPPAPSTSPSH